MKSKIQKITFLAVALLMSAVACSKGGDSGSPAVAAPVPFQYYGAPGCLSCTNPGQGLLASAVAQDGMGTEMDLQFYGDPQVLAMTQGYQPSGYSQGYMQAFPTGAYRGGFAASGTIILGQSAYYMCGLPPGSFQLQTVSPGLWGNDGAGRSGENVTMAIVGLPIQVYVVMSGYTTPAAPAAYGANGQMYPYRFTTTTLVMKRADGGTCQFYMY